MNRRERRAAANAPQVVRVQSAPVSRKSRAELEAEALARGYATPPQPDNTYKTNVYEDRGARVSLH